MFFLEVIDKFLLFLHGGCAIALVGAATHNGLLAIRHLRGDLRKTRLQRTYANIMFWLFAVTFVIGLLVYPAFRVYVRAQYFDVDLPLATGFFEVKEHWLGLALGLLGMYYPMSRNIDLMEDTDETFVYNLVGVALMVVIIGAVAVGQVLVMYKSV